jgi:translation initiation factor IF-3
MDTRDALDLANEVGLQLVEVNPKANPPVCKVMDYGKFKYETAKREREAKKNTTTSELKEVKFRPKTHGHDFDFKVRHCRRFLGDGDKVKLVVQFRGREVTHPETGRAMLDQVCKDVADIATVIQMPSMEGNRMNMVLGPKKDNKKEQPKRPKPAAKADGKPGAPKAEAKDGSAPGGDTPAGEKPAAKAAPKAAASSADDPAQAGPTA